MFVLSRRESCRNSDYSTLEHDRPQHGCPTAFTLSQPYPFATFVFSAWFKNVIIAIFHFLGEVFAKLWKRLLAATCLSVHPSSCNSSVPSGRFFMKYNIWEFFEKICEENPFHYNLTRITATFHELVYIYNTISLNSS